MKIESLKFDSFGSSWHLAETTFDDLTLLVGISGVGKSRILKSILKLKRIAQGASLPGNSWLIKFKTLSGNDYEWSGEIEKKTTEELFDSSSLPFSIETEDPKEKAKFTKEILLKNGKIVIKRD